MSQHGQRQRERAAHLAARKLCQHGISDLDGHFLSDLSRSGASAVAWLADVAAHIDSLDPIEIGAAALLEAQGYERGILQLVLTLDVHRFCDSR